MQKSKIGRKKLKVQKKIYKLLVKKKYSVKPNFIKLK